MSKDLEKLKENNKLSPKEVKILETVLAGNTAIKEIAIELSIRPQTVKNYLGIIYEKLGVKEDDRVKMVKALLLAMKSGQIEKIKPSIDVTKTPFYKKGAGQ